MPERNLIEFVLKGVNQTAAATSQAAAGLNELAKSAKTLQAIALVALAKRTAQATAEQIKLGASSLAARDRLVAFAGGASQADQMLQALARSSNNTIDRMTGMTLASRLLEVGLVDSSSEMEIAGAIVGRLGDQSRSTESRMQSLTMLLANQSTRRLDDFGLSVESVTARQKELVKTGLSVQDAFKAAVFEEAAVKLGILGDQSDTAATKVAGLASSWNTLNQVMAESLALIVTNSGAVESLVELFQGIAQRTIDINEGLALAQELGVAPRVFASAYRDAAEASRTWQGDEENLRAAIEERNAALIAGNGAIDTTVAAEWRAVQASRAIFDIFAGFAEQRVKNKAIESKAVADANAEMAASTASYAATAQGIYTSLEQLELDHAARIDAIMRRGTGGRASQMGAINKRQQDALDTLALEQATRNRNRTLADLERSHQDRMADIRRRGEQTASQIEDDRYQAVLDTLDREQKARLDTLKRQYGKTASGDKRETAEKEHRRKMSGLYTKSARDAEQARFDQAIKEIEFEEAEARLIDEFAAEKERALVTHETRIKAIADKALQDELNAEVQRHAAEVEAIAESRRLQEADNQERLNIVRHFDAQRARETEAAEAHIANVRAESQARALAAEEQSYQRRQAALQAQLDRVNHSFGTAMTKLADKVSEVTGRLTTDMDRINEAIARRNAQGQEPGTVNRRYAQGTNFSRAGMALVGEREPELIELPGGSRVTPLSKLGRGGIVIHNHFGAGSIRSDSDIYALSEQQERSLKLRGGNGVIN